MDKEMIFNKLRQVTIVLAFAALAVSIVSIFYPIDMGEWNIGINFVVTALVALGILTQQGEEPKPISFKTIAEKLKSPVALTAILAVITFFAGKLVSPEVLSTIEQAYRLLVYVFIGIAIGNDPNKQEVYK